MFFFRSIHKESFSLMTKQEVKCQQTICIDEGEGQAANEQLIHRTGRMAKMEIKGFLLMDPHFRFGRD